MSTHVDNARHESITQLPSKADILPHDWSLSGGNEHSGNLQFAGQCPVVWSQPGTAPSGNS